MRGADLAAVMVREVGEARAAVLAAAALKDGCWRRRQAKERGAPDDVWGKWNAVETEAEAETAKRRRETRMAAGGTICMLGAWLRL